MSDDYDLCCITLERFSPDFDSPLCPMVGECGHSFTKQGIEYWFEGRQTDEYNCRKTTVPCVYKCARKWVSKKGEQKEEQIRAFRPANLVPNFALCNALAVIHLERNGRSKEDDEDVRALEGALDIDKCPRCEKLYHVDFETPSGGSAHHNMRAPIVSVCGHTFCKTCIYDEHQKALQGSYCDNVKNIDCPECSEKRAFHSDRLSPNYSLSKTLRYWKTKGATRPPIRDCKQGHASYGVSANPEIESTQSEIGAETSSDGGLGNTQHKKTPDLQMENTGQYSRKGSTGRPRVDISKQRYAETLVELDVLFWRNVWCNFNERPAIEFFKEKYKQRCAQVENLRSKIERKRGTCAPASQSYCGPPDSQSAASPIDRYKQLYFKKSVELDVLYWLHWKQEKSGDLFAHFYKQRCGQIMTVRKISVQRCTEQRTTTEGGEANGESSFVAQEIVAKPKVRRHKWSLSIRELSKELQGYLDKNMIEDCVASQDKNPIYPCLTEALASDEKHCIITGKSRSKYDASESVNETKDPINGTPDTSLPETYSSGQKRLITAGKSRSNHTVHPPKKRPPNKPKASQTGSAATFETRVELRQA